MKYQNKQLDVIGNLFILFKPENHKKAQSIDKASMDMKYTEFKELYDYVWSEKYVFFCNRYNKR